MQWALVLHLHEQLQLIGFGSDNRQRYVQFVEWHKSFAQAWKAGAQLLTHCKHTVSAPLKQFIGEATLTFPSALAKSRICYAQTDEVCRTRFGGGCCLRGATLARRAVAAAAAVGSRLSYLLLCAHCFAPPLTTRHPWFATKRIVFEVAASAAAARRARTTRARSQFSVKKYN